VTPAEALTGRIGGRWYGSYGTAQCPVHDDRDPSLSIRDGERSVLVKCHAGCDPRDIVAALQRDRRWSDIRDPLRKKGKPKHTAEDTRRYLLSIWHECRPISGTPAERYLRGRGIAIELPPSLRYHPALKHTDIGKLLPCMVAAVQGPYRTIFGLHRTYLRAESACKAPISRPRKMLGQHVTGAVRLAAASPKIAVGEGIETCLSFQQATRIPTWAGLSTGGVRSIVLPPLPLAGTVYLLVDLDEAGEHATRVAAERLSREGRKVKLAWPVRGNDFNDALRCADVR
jgi:putative DNA primase/helicase